SGLLASPVLIHRLEVTIGEFHIKAFHSRSVFKAALSNSFLHFDCDFAVESREITEPASVANRARDDVVELRDYFVYGSSKSGYRRWCAHAMPPESAGVGPAKSR